MKDIAATNYAALHAVVEGDTIVVCSVARQSAQGRGRRQHAVGESACSGFPEAMGLTAPAAGWL